MASGIEPKLITFKCDGVVVKGHAVKKGTDENHVAECTAASDKVIGIAQETTTAAEQFVSVAMPGGGGKAVLQGTTVAGDYLCANTDGTLKVSSTTADRVIAVALDGGSAADLVPVSVNPFLHY